MMKWMKIVALTFTFAMIATPGSGPGGQRQDSARSISAVPSALAW